MESLICDHESEYIGDKTKLRVGAEIYEVSPKETRTWRFKYREFAIEPRVRDQKQISDVIDREYVWD